MTSFAPADIRIAIDAHTVPGIADHERDGAGALSHLSFLNPNGAGAR